MVLFVGTLVIYSPAVGFVEINLDDPVSLRDNSLVNPVSPRQVGAALLYVGPLNLWHPVTWWSHQADSALFGFPAWSGRHATNVLLHGMVVVLLFRLAVCLTGTVSGAFCAAVLFSLHPQRVETVAWLTARKELLVAVCVLGSSLWWWEWRRLGGGWRWALAFGMAVAALGSHPVAVVFPVVLLFLDRCVATGQCLARRPGWPAWEHAPFFLAAAGVAFLTLVMHRQGGLSGLEASHGGGDRLGRVILGYWHYAESAVWPVRLRLFAIPPGNQETLRLMAAGGLALMVTTVLLARRWIAREDWTAVLGVAWFLLFLLPVSGIVAMSPYLGADRYTYLPHCGLVIVFAACFPRKNPWKGLMIGGVAIVGACLIPLTEKRLSIWRDSDSLFREEVRLTPESKIAALHLGAALLDANRPREAIEWFERALAIDPAFDLALHNVNLARERLKEGGEHAVPEQAPNEE